MRHTNTSFARFRLAATLALIMLGIALVSLAPPRLANAAPGAPTNLKAVAVTTNEIDLSWSPSTGPNVVSYAIARDGVQLALVDGATLIYNDTTVKFGTRYLYTVAAVDSAGSSSPLSNSARVKTPGRPETTDNMPPSPPEHLAATSGSGYILLDWYDAIDDTDVTAYRIYRDQRKLATVNSGTRQYKDTSARPGTTYSYAVEAIDVNGLRSRPSEPAVGQAHAPLAGAALAAADTFMAASQVSTSALAAAAAYDAKLKRYPYLTDLVNDPADLTKAYVTINWATDRSSTIGTARWGAVAGDGSCTPSNSVTATQTALTVNSVLEYQWKAALTLAPGTQYCYRVYLNTTDLLGGDSSPQFWTQVPIAVNDAFSFAVFGDWGATEPTGTTGDNPDQANVMQQIAASGVRFGLTVGDNGYSSGSQTNYGDLAETGPSISGVFGPPFWTVAGDTIALFPAMGNHGFARSDINHPHLQNWPQDKAVATSGGRYAKDCCIGTSTSYASAWYAFDAGVARFYVLHAAWSDSCSPSAYECDYSQHWAPSSAEYVWLENDLHTHPSALKFAFFHYPLYSDQKAENSDTLLQGVNSLEGLLNRYGVDLAFYGHAHIHQRNLNPNANSLSSYLTGGGGAKLQSIGENPCSAVDAYGIGWSNTNNHGNACGSAPAPTSITQVYHFLKVSVNGTSVTVAPTDELGHTFDIQTYSFPTPDTAIDAGPSGTVTSTAATFSFSSGTAGATFGCRLDGAVFSACTSPTQYSGLAVGPHTFEVRAVNSASDADSTPASSSWTIATDTPTNTPTNTPTDTPTDTPTNTPTNTPTDTPTNTPTDTPTNTPAGLPTDTSTPTSTPTDTPTSTPTNTPTSTGTATATSTPTNTPGSGPTTLTFTTNADAYVEQGVPTTNFGSNVQLMTDNSPVQRSYMRFNVSGVSGSVQSAKLRVFVTDGTTNGPQVFASDSSWVENSITWNTQPGPSGSASDDLGSINSSAGWIEFNVTPLVSGNGTVSFVLIPQSSDALRLSAREGASPPQLVVTYQ